MVEKRSKECEVAKNRNFVTNLLVRGIAHTLFLTILSIE